MRLPQPRRDRRTARRPGRRFLLKPYVDLLHAHPDAALREVLTAVLSADPDDMAHTVTETAAACARLGGAYAPYAGLATTSGQPGVIAMLLNYVQLQPGEALFLGAGVRTPI